MRWRLPGSGTNAKALVQREYAEQCALFEWASLNAARLPGLVLMFAVPNGAFLAGTAGQRAGQWARLAKAGARAGVPDVFLPVPIGPYHGLWIELKAPRPYGAKPTLEQQQWLSEMRLRAYKVALCYGAQDAIDRIEWYYRLC